MNLKARFKSPTFFISLSFAVAVLNFTDTLARLMYSFMLRGASYPLGVYLKPVFFIAQAFALIMFIRSVRLISNPIASDTKLSRFLALQLILTVSVILLYIDFQISALAGMSTAILQLAFYIVYLVSLSGTSFWFALELFQHDKWGWAIVLVFIGSAFVTAFLEPMLFWSQNYAVVVFPMELAFVATYAPHVLMFIAAMLALSILIVKQIQRKNYALFSWLSLLLLIPAFLIPLLWNGYRDGLINFIIRDVFYWGFGYSGREWSLAGLYVADSVSFYFMTIVAYVLVWRWLSRRSDHSLAFSLIVLGVASFPWNGVTTLRADYSSILGNVISLSAIISGASMLKGWRG